MDEGTLVALARRAPDERPRQRPLPALRRAAGVSQEELAHHVGVSVRTIKHWEAGTRPVPLAVVRPMARCLQRPLRTVLAAAGLELPPVPSPRSWPAVGLPEVLTALRRSSGWSAAAVGRRIGVSGSTVRGWERGSSRPSVSAARRLEMMHGLPAGSLVRLRTGAGTGVAVRRAG